MTATIFDTTHFPKAKTFWYQGKFYDWSEGLLHPMTHALHYGTSVFEGIRAYSTDKGTAVFRLSEHIDRFLYSAGVIKMTSPYGKDEIIRTVLETIRKNKMDGCYIRPMLFYSYGGLGIVPKFSPVELAIATWEWGAYLGDKSWNGVAVYIHPLRRVHHSQVDMRAKLGGLYIQSMICGIETRALGFDEAVFLNLEGRVAEGPGENIFVVAKGALKTNDVSESILEGITRTSVLEVARDLGYRTTVGPITKEDMFGADEVFFTGTAVEVVPIIRITDGSDPKTGPKGHIVGPGQPGPVTDRIRKRYLEIVRGKVKKFEKWLTYVNE